MLSQSPVKQIAAIHDLSGCGRTSLSVVIPILSTMGIKVCPLPTAVLSSHSRFEGYHFTDLTEQMQPIIDHWEKWILQLSDAGPGIVVVTSVPDKTSGKKFSVIAYNRNGSRFWKVPIDYIPADFPGTGDCFTSVLTGSLMQGDSLPIALDRAVHFISYGVRATYGYNYDPNQGILLERVLNRLNFPMPVSSYEVF
jgi:pyridoxine kinase